MHTAFVEEAKAYQRLLMFAKKAEEEDLPQIADLLRAVARARDFLGPMRNEASTEDLKNPFLEAVKRRKPYFT